MFKKLIQLITGSALGQVLGLILIPVMTHIYFPEQIAQYQIAFSIALFSATLMSGKLEIAIPTLSDKGAVVAFSVSVLKLVIFQFILFVVLILSYYMLFVLEIIEIELGASISILLWGVLIGLFIAINSILRFLLIEYKKFKSLSVVVFIQGGGRSFFQVAFSVLDMAGLFIGDLISRLSILFVCKKSSLVDRELFLNELKLANKETIKSILKKYWRYPVWVLPSTILNTSMALMLIPMIYSKYGLVEAGVIAISYRILSAPNSLISGVTADLLFSRFSTYYKANDVRSLAFEFYLAAIILTLVSAVGFVILYFGMSYIALLFGDGYANAEHYVQILIPWFASQLIVSPLSRIIFIFEKQVYKLIFDVGVVSVLLWMALVEEAITIEVFIAKIANSMVILYFLYFFILLATVIFSCRTQSAKSLKVQ